MLEARCGRPIRRTGSSLNTVGLHILWVFPASGSASGRNNQPVWFIRDDYHRT